MAGVSAKEKAHLFRYAQFHIGDWSCCKNQSVLTFYGYQLSSVQTIAGIYGWEAAWEGVIPRKGLKALTWESVLFYETENHTSWLFPLTGARIATSQEFPRRGNSVLAMTHDSQCAAMILSTAARPLSRTTKGMPHFSVSGGNATTPSSVSADHAASAQYSTLICARAYGAIRAETAVPLTAQSPIRRPQRSVRYAALTGMPASTSMIPGSADTE